MNKKSLEEKKKYREKMLNNIKKDFTFPTKDEKPSTKKSSITSGFGKSGYGKSSYGKS